MNKKTLTIPSICFLYVGVIMGAGFASGKESWQFFGIFGKVGYLGALFSTVFFMILALMLTYIALSKNTTDIGKLICPTDNPLLVNGVGYLLAGIYYTLIISMSAAGGSLLNQQFGLDEKAGGIIIVILVIITVLGNFERMSRVFDKVIPVIFIMSLLSIALVLFHPGITESNLTVEMTPSVLTPTWWSAGIIFASYNGLGMISISGKCALQAKNKKTAFLGAALGTLFLGLLMILLMTALFRDPTYSTSLVLPMLGYISRISRPLSMVYALVLYGAIYSSASSAFYGFSTKIPEGKWKNKILVITAIAGFFLGLIGFQNVVSYLYPAQGYLGIVIIGMIIVNFFKEIKK